MKKVKRVKIKFKNLFVFMIVIFFVIMIVYCIMNKKINNIYISGNVILEEQEVLELINFEDYLKYYQISERKIENRLKTSLVVESVDVKKSLFSLCINLKEYKTLWYQEHDNSVMLSSGESINLDNKVLGIPSFINEIDDKYKYEFIEKLSKVDNNIFRKISEISYEPTEIDKERFLFYMNDKNYVYINISRMELINKYDEMLPKLDSQKGILYLDSGNHFEIKK